MKAIFKYSIRGDTMEDAAMAGALAIRVPPESRDLVGRSWDKVLIGQRIV
jgi:hypothetical protein